MFASQKLLFAGSFGLILLGLVAAIPAPEPQLTPVETRIIPTVTVSRCSPPGSCRKICATTTVTQLPTKCPFDILKCPVADCIPIPYSTVTSTQFCRSGGVGCTDLPSTSCEKLPFATVIPPCPKKCPEDLCPIPVTTVAIACTQTPTGVIWTGPIETLTYTPPETMK